LITNIPVCTRQSSFESICMGCWKPKVSIRMTDRDSCTLLPVLLFRQLLSSDFWLKINHFSYRPAFNGHRSGWKFPLKPNFIKNSAILIWIFIFNKDGLRLLRNINSLVDIRTSDGTRFQPQNSYSSTIGVINSPPIFAKTISVMTENLLPNPSYQ